MNGHLASARGQAAQLVKWLVSTPPIAFLTVFFVLPALIMVVASFRYPGEFGGLAALTPLLGTPDVGLTTETYQFFFSDFVYGWVFLRSFLVAGITTLLCILLAYPLAWLIARSPKRHRDFMVLLVVLPFASSFLIRIYAWIMILGPLNLLYTPTAVIICMVYVHLPFMVLPLYTNLEKHDMTLLDAAQDLGANAWQRFWKVTFPLSLPGIYSGSALVFIPVLGMFAVPELVGGQSDVIIGNLIKEQFLDNRDWPLGSMLSIMLTIAVLGLAGLASMAARGRKGAV